MLWENDYLLSTESLKSNFRHKCSIYSNITILFYKKNRVYLCNCTVLHKIITNPLVFKEKYILYKFKT